jgi:hypothetical protein
MTTTRPTTDCDLAPTGSLSLSDQLERWLTDESEKTLGSLVRTFGDKSFAILLLLLLAVPALPLPTGGVTHVFELIAALIALELLAGRHEVWLPQRWRGLELAGPRQHRFIAGLMKLIRRFEHHSRPRLTFLFHRRLTHIVFGLLAIAGTAGAFLAPPFSGLDTLPALSVVLLSLSLLLEDALVALVAIILGATGIGLELALGAAALHGVSSIL